MNKIKRVGKILLLGLILLLVIRCIYKISNPLYRAYIFDSEEKMESFFNEWNKMYTNNYNLINNDTIKLIYEVFDSFYTPRNLKRIGNSEWGDSIYTSPKYLLIQDKIKYTILKSNAYYDSIYSDTYIYKSKNDSVLFIQLKTTDSNRYNEILQFAKDEDAWDNFLTIENFRPKTIYSKEEILYNNENNNNIINSYLGTRHIDFGIPNIMSPAHPYRSSQKRQDFLMPYIVVWHGHWGGYWHVFSHPLVTGISLENDLKTAYVNFRVVYQFGNATLKLEDNKWNLVDSRMTGIE